MLPVELSVQQQGDSAVLLLRIDADLPWFRGHFPGQPILPGVAQLDWVIHYGTRLLAPDRHFSSVENIKFQQPILPGATLQLTLHWLGEKGLNFQFQRAVRQTFQPVSSGKIRLC